MTPLKINLRTTLVVITMHEMLDSQTLSNHKCKVCLKTIHTNLRRKNYHFDKTYQISKITNNNFMITIMVDLVNQTHISSNSLTKNLKPLDKIILIILNRCILKIRILLGIKRINLNEQQIVQIKISKFPTNQTFYHLQVVHNKNQRHQFNNNSNKNLKLIKIVLSMIHQLILVQMIIQINLMNMVKLVD